MKRNILLWIFILLAAYGLNSCKSPAAAGQDKVSADSILAGIERGPCFGQCPEYKAVVYTSGFAEYFGERNTPRLGYYQARLSKQELAAFEDLQRKYNMAEADSEYVNKLLADYPAFWLTIRDSKGSRRILVNHEEPPARIMDFTTELDGMFSQLPWAQAKRSDDQ